MLVLLDIPGPTVPATGCALMVFALVMPHGSAKLVIDPYVLIIVHILRAIVIEKSIGVIVYKDILVNLLNYI